MCVFNNSPSAAENGGSHVVKLFEALLPGDYLPIMLSLSGGELPEKNSISTEILDIMILENFI